MFDRLFGPAYDYTLRHRRAVTALVLALCAVSALGLFLNVRYDGDVLMMLPEDRDIERSIGYFRSEDASGKVLISLGLGDGDHKRSELLAAVDDIAAGLSRDVFTGVMTGIDDEDATRGMDDIIGSLPFLLSEDELRDLVAPRLEDDEVQKRLRAGYLSMFRPGGVMAGRMIMEDPLGLRAIALRKLSALSASLGFDVMVREGHLVSTDERHALIVASTEIEATDTIGSGRLADALEASLALLPGHITADVVSGHLHTVSNEQTIKSDIRLTLAIATAGFILLFVVFLGDAGSVLVFLVPAASVLVAANASYMFLGRLSYSVIGLAAVVAGISVDYGIHVYVESRRAEEGAHPVKGIARPITYGALTTVGMFASFFISHIEGYHQMAVFSILSVLCSLLLALLVLPHLISGWGSGSRRRIMRLAWMEGGRLSGRPAFIIWLVISLVMGYLALGVRLDADVRAIDGTSRAIQDAEERFLDTWGQRRLAVLVARAPDIDSARRLQDELVYEKGIFDGIDMDSVSTIATLWPSKGRMRDNARAWEEFWSPGRQEALRNSLRKQGEAFGYSPDAFGPFFASLKPGNAPEGLPDISITERYMRELPGGMGWQVSVFFPDTAESTGAVMERVAGMEDVFVVSREALGRSISRAVTSDMKMMTITAGAAIVFLAVFFLRDLKLVAGALVPVLTSTLWLAGGVAALGLRLNVANLIAFIVVMGLCVDYGIFMAHRSRRTEKERSSSATVLAVTLSSLSSLIGAGVLIFAQHPALFSIGVTLVIGLGSGYLSAVFVVPWVTEESPKVDG